MRTALLCCLVLLIGGCASAPRSFSTDQERASVHALLERFHDAASRADGPTYFGCLRHDAVFIGTDPGERWTRDEFKAAFQPYFDDGRGWTYVPRERHLRFSPDGTTVWFDELLDNEKYGVCRGVGVITRQGHDTWTIALYGLSLTVPNDVATDVVERIRQYEEQNSGS